MVKKFAIKPWMIIVASVVVIGGVALFFVLNKGDDKSTPTDKSSESVNKKSYISPQEHNDYWRKTKKKREEAMEAEAKAQEECRKGKHPKTKKKYKNCEEKDAAEVATGGEKAVEKTKQDAKKKPLTTRELNNIRRKAQRMARQQILKRRIKGIPHCAAGGKKGDTNQNGYKMMKNGCKECEKGYFLDEDGKCQRSAAECNDPRHIADEKGTLITDDMADKLLLKEEKLKCICPHIHPSAQGTMYRYKDGMCHRKFKTKNGFEYKDSFKKGYEDVYASNEEKKKAVNDKKLHSDFLKDPNFYQEEGEKDEEAKDYKGNVIEWEKDVIGSAWNRGDQIRSREEQKYAEKINDMMKNGVVEGKFYKKVDDNIINTNFGDKDKSVFYINAGGLCYPNEGEDKNASRFCDTSGSFFGKFADSKKAVTKSNFVITPECVF